MKLMLTGASGFVGGGVLAAAKSCGFSVRSVSRSDKFVAQGDVVYVPTITADTDWSAAVSEIDVVIHCAAKVHVSRNEETDPLSAFRAVNVEGTLRLARQSAAAGVRRFIFISSIKVNGEGRQIGFPYVVDDDPAPEDAYGISKAEAEAGLRLLSLETGMEIVIIRPPLVYGPGVKGNFYSLLSFVARGLPLPLGSAKTNKRSLVSLENLVDLILTCIDHPNAANQTFLVSDGEDLSTADLLRRIGKILNKPVRFISMPVSILTMVLNFLGKKTVAQRLLGSLQVDIGKTCTLLNWKPPISVDEGLRTITQEIF